MSTYEGNIYIARVCGKLDNKVAIENAYNQSKWGCIRKESTKIESRQ